MYYTVNIPKTATTMRIFTDKVTEAMQESVIYMQRVIRTLTPFRTGDLRRSEWTSVAQFSDVIRGEVYSDIHYAQYVEPWARMFYKGADVSISEVMRIFEEKVSEGVKIFNGLRQVSGRAPSLGNTSQIWWLTSGRN